MDWQLHPLDERVVVFYSAEHVLLLLLLCCAPRNVLFGEHAAQHPANKAVHMCVCVCECAQLCRCIGVNVFVTES